MKNLNSLIDDLLPQIEEINEFIYENAEEGNKEFISTAYLVDVLRKEGFEVQFPYLGVETAFRADFKTGDGPKIAFLAEYDALPGYGPNKDEYAHACGHNWIAATCLGSAIALSKLASSFNGTIVVMGAPAEETTGGKCDLVNQGAFDDIDASMQMHLSDKLSMSSTTLAMDSIEFNFKGVASHAAGCPENGVNALDAVQLMFAGVNAMRLQMQKDASVAGIITESGVACNIIPDRAGCRFYIRAKTRAYLEVLTQKIINCARGAELMTGATLEYHNFENTYYDFIYNDNLREVMRGCLSELTTEEFVDKSAEGGGSSDIGNVSHVCKTCYCEIPIGGDAFAHHESFLDYVHGENAKESLLLATKGMANTALKVFLDPSLI